MDVRELLENTLNIDAKVESRKVPKVETSQQKRANRAVVTTFHSKPSSMAEAMRTAGLDWEVKSEPLFRGDNGKESTIANSFYRSDTKDELHVAAKGWTPLQNRDAFAWFDPFIHEDDVTLDSVWSIDKGKQIIVSVSLDYRQEVVKGDEVGGSLILYNSHNGTWACGLKFINERLVCKNQMPRVIKEGRRWRADQVHFRHTLHVKNRMDEAARAINLAKRNFGNSIEEYQAMAKKDITSEMFQQYVHKLFINKPYTSDLEFDEQLNGLRALPKLQELFESGIGTDIQGVRGTVWGAFNAVTEFATHHQNLHGSAEMSESDIQREHLLRCWKGTGADILQNAHKEAVKLLV